MASLLLSRMRIWKHHTCKVILLYSMFEFSKYHKFLCKYKLGVAFANLMLCMVWYLGTRPDKKVNVLCVFSRKEVWSLAKAKTRIKVEEQLTKPSLCYFQSCLALGSCLGIFVINPQHFRVCTASVLDIFLSKWVNKRICFVKLLRFY